MPAIALPSRPWPRRAAATTRSWAIAVALVVAGFCTASSLMLYDLRRDTWDQAVMGERNLVTALSQDIGRTVELYDFSLRSVADRLTEPELQVQSPRVQDRLLFDPNAAGRDLGSILVLDRDGVVTRGSAPRLVGVELGDQDWFQAQKADPARGLFISAPFRRRFDGNDEVIALSRGLRAADGSFAGVVVGTIRIAYLQSLFSREDLGGHGNANLFRLDGTCLMRLPYAAADVGRSFARSANFQRFLTAPSGTFSGTASTDGVRRIYSFSRVGDLPLVLDVARAEDDVFAVWREKAAIIGVALAALCLVAAGLGAKLSFQLERTARTERRLSKSEAEYRLLADNAQDVIVRLDPSLRRTYVSPACRAVFGYDAEDLVGDSPREIIHPEDWPAVAAAILSAREDRSTVETVYRLKHRDGHVVWIEGRYGCLPDGRGFIAALRDVTSRKRAEEHAAALNAELAHLARNDALTGLANRRRFDEVLEAEWQRISREGGPVSLLLLDVDRFKLFNDRYGHQGGDSCLRAVADAVRGVASRPGDLAARYGGEEIAVVLPATDAVRAAKLAEGIRRAVEALALPHEGNPRCGSVVTVSIGCATSEPGAAKPNPAALIAAADAMLYEAKRAGRNRVVTVLPIEAVAPAPSDEAERLAVLDSYGVVGALAPSETLDRICRLAAHLLGAPVAFLSVVGRDVVTLVGSHGTAAETLPREDAYCAHTILGDAPLVIPDTAADPRFVDNALTRRGVGFYAGAPLVSPGAKFKLGALCIADGMPRPPLDDRGRELLADLARFAMEELDGRRAGAVAHPTGDDALAA